MLHLLNKIKIFKCHYTLFPSKGMITRIFGRNAIKCVLISHVRLFVTPWTVAHQAPLSMEFSRQEYWSGQPFPSPGIFMTQGLNLGLLHCRQILYCLSYHLHTHVGLQKAKSLEEISQYLSNSNIFTIQHRNSSSEINLQKYSPKYTKMYVYEFQCSIIYYRKRNV